MSFDKEKLYNIIEGRKRKKQGRMYEGMKKNRIQDHQQGENGGMNFKKTFNKFISRNSEKVEPLVKNDLHSTSSSSSPRLPDKHHKKEKEHEKEKEKHRNDCKHKRKGEDEYESKRKGKQSKRRRLSSSVNNNQKQNTEDVKTVVVTENTCEKNYTVEQIKKAVHNIMSSKPRARVTDKHGKQQKQSPNSDKKETIKKKSKNNENRIAITEQKAPSRSVGKEVDVTKTSTNSSDRKGYGRNPKQIFGSPKPLSDKNKSNNSQNCDSMLPIAKPSVKLNSGNRDTTVPVIIRDSIENVENENPKSTALTDMNVTTDIKKALRNENDFKHTTIKQSSSSSSSNEHKTLSNELKSFLKSSSSSSTSIMEYINHSNIISARKNLTFRETFAAKISQMSQILHLAVCDLAMKESTIDNAKMIESEQLLDSEKLRAERDYKYMLKVRSKEFCPLLSVMFKAQTKYYTIESVLFLYHILLTNLIKIKKSNVEFEDKLKGIISSLLESGCFRDPLVKKIFKINDDEFKTAVSVFGEINLGDNKLADNKNSSVTNNSDKSEIDKSNSPLKSIYDISDDVTHVSNVGKLTDNKKLRNEENYYSKNIIEQLTPNKKMKKLPIEVKLYSPSSSVMECINHSNVIAAKNYLTTKLYAGEISTMSQILHLSVYDLSKKESTIDNAKIIQSENLLKSEIVRAERAYKTMVNLRSIEFCRLLSGVFKPNTQYYTEESVLFLYHVLLTDLIRIKKSNIEFQDKLKGIISSLLESGRFRDPLVNKIFKMNDDEFKTAVSVFGEMNLGDNKFGNNKDSFVTINNSVDNSKSSKSNSSLTSLINTSDAPQIFFDVEKLMDHMFNNQPVDNYTSENNLIVNSDTETGLNFYCSNRKLFDDLNGNPTEPVETEDNLIVNNGTETGSINCSNQKLFDDLNGNPAEPVETEDNLIVNNGTETGSINCSNRKLFDDLNGNPTKPVETEDNLIVNNGTETGSINCSNRKLFDNLNGNPAEPVETKDNLIVNSGTETGSINYSNRKLFDNLIGNSAEPVVTEDNLIVNSGTETGSINCSNQKLFNDLNGNPAEPVETNLNVPVSNCNTLDLYWNPIVSASNDTTVSICADANTQELSVEGFSTISVSPDDGKTTQDDDSDDDIIWVSETVYSGKGNSKVKRSKLVNEKPIAVADDNDDDDVIIIDDDDDNKGFMNEKNDQSCNDKTNCQEKEDKLETVSDGEKKLKYDEANNTGTDCTESTVREETMIQDHNPLESVRENNIFKTSTDCSCRRNSNSNNGRKRTMGHFDGNSSKPSRAAKQKKIDMETIFNNEKIEIAKREKYKLDLELFKLERELQIQPSEFTKQLNEQ